MEAAQPPPTAPLTRGGYRGRGNGMPMRGGFDRGRGRGMGRGHYMGLGRGGIGGPPPMMSGRGGMRPPRAMSYQMRGTYMPRGAGGPLLRGGRPPLYSQPPKQHSGSENNKTVSPVPNTASNAGEATTVPGTQSSPTPVSNGGVHHQMRGAPRGRGLMSRGRGSYMPYSNGTYNGSDQNSMGMRRGGPPRGRGGYGQSMSRPPMAHSANTQIAPVPTLKRGAIGGPPGPKRGRYEHSPYSTRPMAPKYHQHVQSVSQTSSPYSVSHQQTQSHHFAGHDQSQIVDPYSHGYSVPAAQTSYNGYVQSGYGTTPAQGSANYSHGQEYDQSQYQGYNSSAYATQDARYQSYGQDYTQTYGAPAIDYSAPPPDYSQQQGQGYDERAYAGYDSQSYQQSYSNTTGYY